VPFIKHLSVVQGFPNQGIALFVTPGRILRTACHQIDREIRVNTVQDFQGLPKAFPIEREHHQEVDVGVRSRRPISIRTEEDNSLRLELAGNPFA
jgi:hypothetical protein